MPVIDYHGTKIVCEKGANLRRVLIEHDLHPHNGNSKFFNCCGIGSCGTCAVKIYGSQPPLTGMEKMRLNLPPHHFDNGMRLSCQVKVTHDISVVKGEGFWGQLFDK